MVGFQFYLFGGQCSNHNSLHGGKDSSEYQVIPYQMNPKADSAEKMFEPLEEGRLAFPRVRSACITDGTNYIFLIGSNYSGYTRKVERYEVSSGQVVEY